MLHILCLDILDIYAIKSFQWVFTGIFRVRKTHEKNKQKTASSSTGL